MPTVQRESVGRKGVAKKSIRGAEDGRGTSGDSWKGTEMDANGEKEEMGVIGGEGGEGARDGLSFYHLSLSTRFS